MVLDLHGDARSVPEAILARLGFRVAATVRGWDLNVEPRAVPQGSTATSDHAGESDVV
jgi:hypothetical protein